MQPDPQPVVPPARPAPRTAFLRRLIPWVFPPLGLVLLWTGGQGTRRARALGTVGILLYCLPYTVAMLALLTRLGWVEMEWKGGFGPSFVQHKTRPDYTALESNRVSRPRAVPRATPAHAKGANYWTDFRGPRRDGVSTEPAVLTDWPKDGPRCVWRQPIGGGYASFVMADGLAFTIEQRRADEAVTAYDLETGREVWAFRYPAEFTEWMGGDGPRATPTWHEGLVHSLGATGELVCLRGQTGELLWRTNLLTANQSANLRYGLCASPVVVGEQLIVLTGDVSSGNSVVGYDRRTGRKLWSALSERQAYTSPLLATLAGRPQVLVVTASRALGLDLTDHRVLWEFPWTVQYDNAICTPTLVGTNQFVIAAGYGAGAALLEVTATADGFAARPVWRNRNLKTKFNPAVLYEGHLYGLDEGVLACVEVATGERKWREGRYGYGQLLRAADHLIVLGGEGELALVRATPERFEERARVRALTGKTWNVPALAEGRLLVRNAAEMACYDLRRPVHPPE